MIFLFKQSKIDQGKSFILEEHMDKINRYLKRDLNYVYFFGNSILIGIC